ncbi:MAG: flagellar basal body P-ring formation chaperone FlgA [Sphingomonadales bacterium]
MTRSRFGLTGIAALVLAATVMIVATAAVAEPRLKPTILVEDDIVTLGDLFDDAGAAALVVVTDAPPPGRRHTLSLRLVTSVARQNGIDFDGRTAARRITVERAGHKIPIDDISRAIKAALRDIGVSGNKQIRLSNPRLALYVPLDSDAAVSVDRIDYDRNGGRFEAFVVTGADTSSRLRVTGQAVSVLEVPVLRSAVTTGQLIERGNITWTTIPMNRVNGNVVTESALLINQAARRTIRPGVPVRSSDVRRPVTVAKGALVTMIVTAPAMTLTTVGRALEDGASGDAIRVLNTVSHTTVQGVVLSPNKVRVPMMARFVSAAR